jgi:hypothetical protein
MRAVVKPRIRRKFMQPLSSHDDAERNPYSPVLCISLLLIVGLIIKIGPVVHLLGLGQN